MDPFHVVAWATKAVDKVRRGMWNTLRGEGNIHQASWQRLMDDGHVVGR